MRGKDDALRARFPGIKSTSFRLYRTAYYHYLQSCGKPDSHRQSYSKFPSSGRLRKPCALLVLLGNSSKQRRFSYAVNREKQEKKSSSLPAVRIVSCFWIDAGSGEGAISPTHGWGKQNIWLAASGCQTRFCGQKPAPTFVLTSGVTACGVLCALRWDGEGQLELVEVTTTRSAGLSWAAGTAKADAAGGCGKPAVGEALSGQLYRRIQVGPGNRKRTGGGTPWRRNELTVRATSGNGKVGCWEGQYTAGYDPKTGNRIAKNVLGKAQGEAQDRHGGKPRSGRQQGGS